jgi:hypothetical protein
VKLRTLRSLKTLRTLMTLKALRRLRTEVVIIGEASTKNNACYIEMCTRYLINTKIKTGFYCVSAGFSGVSAIFFNLPTYVCAGTMIVFCV